MALKVTYMGASYVVKDLSRFDLPVRNESNNGPMAFFPLYNFQIFFRKH